MEMPASLPGKERGQSVKAEAFVCIPHVKDKGTAVDVEILPLVMCKDCDHWDRGNTEECENSDSVCFRNGRCAPDFFCRDGERTKRND